MRILPILNYNTSFTSKRFDNSFDDYFDRLEEENNVHSFIQYEDADSLWREKMRAHMLEGFMGTGVEESDCIVRYAGCLEDTNIPNLQNIAPGCYRGASLAKFPNYFHLLNASGVENVIDLVADEKLKNLCAENNINYYSYPVEFEYWGNSIFKTDAELLEGKKQELNKKGAQLTEYMMELEQFINYINYERENFIKKFIDLTKVINKKSFYICCEQGEYRTPNILALNTFFNPQWSGKCIYPTNPFIYEKFIKMYENLTANNKKILGFTEKHELFLKEHFSRIKKMFF